MSEEMITRITGITLLGDPLPIVGKKYGIGRITKIEGAIPNEVKALRYTDDKEQISPIEVEGQTLSIGSAYVFVEILPEEDDSNVANLRIIENYGDLLSPFEFPEEQVKAFEEYFMKKRCADAMVQPFSMEIEDEDSSTGKTKCIAFYNIEEVAYIESEAKKLTDMFRPDKISSLQSDTPIHMVFADILTRSIDVFNQINFYDKAKDVANIISSIRAINQDGVKDTLTFAAIDDFFEMTRKELRVKPS